MKREMRGPVIDGECLSKRYTQSLKVRRRPFALERMDPLSFYGGDTVFAMMGGVVG